MIHQRFTELLNDITTASKIIAEEPLVKKFTDDLEVITKTINELHFADITQQKLDTELKNFRDCLNMISQTWVSTYAIPVVDAYCERINAAPYGFLGGTGHYVSYNPRFAPHWVIRPAYYEVCKPTPVEQLCMLIGERRPVISPDITTERWGN